MRNAIVWVLDYTIILLLELRYKLKHDDVGPQ